MPINAKDLPPTLRKKLTDAAPAKPRRRSESPVAAGELGYRCECGETFPGFNAAERHANQAGHHRLSMLLEVA